MEQLVATLFAQAAADREGWSHAGWPRSAAAISGCAKPFLEWARAHDRWSFVVAEAASEVCAKPAEAAAWVLHAIIDELLDELHDE